MSTALFTHSSCLEHDMGSHHPERPDRLRAVLRALEGEEFMFLDRREAPRATFSQIEMVHASNYIEMLEDCTPASGHYALDGDTVLSPGSFEAALRSAGGACAAVDAVVGGEVRNAFVATRPPGHHAERAEAMGFCLFCNAAIAARHAIHMYDTIQKVAVVDFDVHHGNGTQSLMEDDPNLFYASTHQSPGYPETGKESETGVANNVCNCELAPGSKPDVFRAAMIDRIFPALRAFNPDLLIISAGFDAHARDPLAYLRLTNEDFAWVTRELLLIADECCNSRVVSVLEGGYDLEALASASAAHVKALMGH